MKRFFLKTLIALLLAPAAALWARSQEKRIRKYGEPLEERQLEWAKSVGIHHPENIRILIEDTLRFPAPRRLMAFLEKRGIGLQQAAGMSLRNGIHIHSEATLTDRLLRH